MSSGKVHPCRNPGPSMMWSPGCWDGKYKITQVIGSDSKWSHSCFLMLVPGPMYSAYWGNTTNRGLLTLHPEEWHPILSECCFLASASAMSLEGQYQYAISWLFLDGIVYDKTNRSHGHGSTSAIPSLYSGSPGSDAMLCSNLCLNLAFCWQKPWEQES